MGNSSQVGFAYWAPSFPGMTDARNCLCCAFCLPASGAVRLTLALLPLRASSPAGCGPPAGWSAPSATWNLVPGGGIFLGRLFVLAAGEGARFRGSFQRPILAAPVGG
jgi:hypothetical protein